MMPLMNVAMFLVVGVLFFVLVTRVFQFLTSQDEGIRKKATGMILRTVVGILVILASNQIVQAIFGTRDDIFLNPRYAQTLGDVGTEVFENSSIPIIYEVINRVMGLAVLIVLVLIIFQTFQMLTKPDDPEMAKKIKKTLLYVTIGVVVIGTGYLITNVLLVN